jgi:hypothetical protein
MLLTNYAPRSSFSQVSGPAHTNVWFGTRYTPALNAKGAWTNMMTLTGDINHLTFLPAGAGFDAGSRQIKMDIGVDPAGGTAYSVLIADILVGGIGWNSNPYWGSRFNFPICIRSGTSIAVRGWTTGASYNISAWMQGQGQFSLPVPYGSFCETIGVNPATASGTAVTPGLSGDKGAWFSLGTTTNNLFHWSLSFQVSDTTQSPQTIYIDLAYSTNGTSYTIILPDVLFFVSLVELGGGTQPYCQYFPVPAGATLYARAALGEVSGVTAANLNVAAHGIGG